ncbi:MAG: hypothetical protein HZA93_27090 [Verrucomicrobia bacterium]|nr:hypothetical protein [Verrucomicrobiota bacterium]
MKTIRLILAAALFAIAPALLSAAAGGGTRVRVIMIVASNEKGKSDPKLAAYEANLKRILRFESYRAVAEGSAVVTAGGDASVALTRGHRVELKGEGGAVRATYFDGSKKVAAATLPPGRPTILGGPAWNDKGDVCAVIIVPQ